MDKIRWGIVGTGGIAHRFAKAICNVDNAQLCAVASRSFEKAEEFGNEFSIPKRFSSYEEMALSHDIDAAYIATPHGLHADCAILFLSSGKGVLSEKPMSVNSREVCRMITCARENNAFLMEAMWGRLVPGTEKLIDIVGSGELGSIMGVQASFCYDMSDEPEHHAFKPEYGGGSLLDVGVYALNFASWYIDSEVEAMNALAHVDTTQVDVHCCALLKYKNGAIAELSSAMKLRKPNEGYIYGENGYVHVNRFYAPESIDVHIYGKTNYTTETPYAGNGFEEQILEASRCMLEGLKECPRHTLEKTLYITGQMDKIRRLIGVKYPQD